MAPQTSCCPEPAVRPTAREVAEWVGGELREAALAPERLNGLGTLERAEADHIAFIANDRALAQAAQCPAGLLITSSERDCPGRARVVVAEPWRAVACVMERLYPAPVAPDGVHPTAVVGDGVEMGRGVSVGPCCVVGDGCVLGAGVVLGPHCIVEAGCRIGAASRLVARVTCMGVVSIGERVLIHPGAVLGADGFKFEVVEGRPMKIPQVGVVVIEDDVEIGANTTIDRAFLYETRIGRGAKIDNLVQIAHNVEIGPGCLLAGQVGVAGSTRLGAGCILGGAAGLRDGLTFGDGVQVAARSGVNRDQPDGAVICGAPAVPIKQFARTVAHWPKLPDYARRLRALEKKMEEHHPDRDS